MALKSLISDLNKLKNPEKGEFFKRFFKTGKGQYGEGDVFIGLTVPQQRAIAKKYLNLTLHDLQNLLDNPIHEYRLISLFILIDKYKKGNLQEKKDIVKFYLKNSKKINNWDLIDSSSDKILGAYLMDQDKTIIYKLAKSENLWERRIAIIATFYFIKNNKFGDTIAIAEILLKDKHDLMHKAVGWMLREIGKRDKNTEIEFLKKFYKTMPRTMLRYAIEHFSEHERKIYMQK